MRIEEIDKNLQAASTLNIPDIRYYNALEEPFALYGLYRPRETGEYRRLPENIAESVSLGVRDLSIHTSGGRVRFKTDSPYVAIKAVLFNGGQMPHMPISGSHGFDLYVYSGVEDIYYNSFFPTCSEPDSFESVAYFPEKSMREITIHFPLYSEVKELLIGIAKDAELVLDLLLLEKRR